MTAHEIAGIALSAGFGLVLGLAYFRLLRLAVSAQLAARGHRRAALLHLARPALAVPCLVLAARLGALPLLAAMVGFLLARRLALRAQEAPT
jgi:NhaP-type Na+/H+ or K+/H+ antiporter